MYLVQKKSSKLSVPLKANSFYHIGKLYNWAMMQHCIFEMSLNDYYMIFSLLLIVQLFHHF